MSRNIIFALVAIVSICCATAYLWFTTSLSSYDSSPEVVVVPAHTASTVTTGVAARAVERPKSSATTKRPAKLVQQFVKSQDMLESTIAGLSSADEEKWIAGARRLARMDPSDQWHVLSAPGVADQAVAKAMRRNIATNCTPSLRSVQMQSQHGVRDDGESGQPEMTAVDEWCKRLLETHSVNYYMEQVRELAQSTELLAPDVFVPAVENDRLSEPEHSKLDQFLIQRLQAAGNSVEIKQLVLRLWGLRSSLFVNEWPRVATISRFQKGRMQVALATSVACRATYSCGPMSASTIGFCAVMPGVHCDPGQSFDAALIANLSVYEYGLLQDMAHRALAVRGM